MPSNPRFTRAGRLVLGVFLTTGTPMGAAQSAGTAARVVLLPAGERASIVVEFGDEAPNATAIEPADNRSFAVEIGPVRGRVANQVLQAGKQSTLVSEVRVTGAAQARAGTLLTVQVIAKAPVSGVVRRARRRIYIDLAPLAVTSGSWRRGPAVPD